MLEKLKKINYEKLLTVLIVLGAFSLYFSWSCILPFDKSPDEAMKYTLCEYISEHGKLPHGGDPEVRHPDWGISYGFTPILAYIISACFMSIAKLFTADEFTIEVAARFAMVLFNTGTVFMITKIAPKFFKGIYRWLFVIIIAFLPQFAFLGAYINNDSLASLAISMIIYSWLIGMEKDWNIKSCIFLGISVGVCALSYYNTYGFILFSVIFFIASLWMKNKDIKEILKKGLLISAIAFLIAGWWFIRSAIIYNGDFLGLKTEAEYQEKYAIERCRPSTKITPQKQYESLIPMMTHKKWPKKTFCSFIGVFDYMILYIPECIYIGYFALFTFALIGVLPSLKKMFIYNKEKNNDKQKILLHYCFVITIIIPIILSIYYSYTSDFQPQGRYVMPGVIPFIYFVIYGIQNIFEKIANLKILKDLKWTQKIKNLILLLLCLIIIVTCIYCLTNVVIPYYNEIKGE